jgi:hypothetical protein
MGVFVEGVIDPLPVMVGDGVVIVKARQLPELCVIDEGIPLAWILDFIVSAPGPF